MNLSRIKIAGPILVGMAAFLWATDALVRYPAVDRIDPAFIVFFEHVLAVILLLPWMLYKYQGTFLTLSRREWISAIFSGIGGSAVATVFFTASFAYVNPSVAVLLQKLQPIMVVLIAFFFLGERPKKKFYFWGTIAVAAGIVLSFPDLKFDFLTGGVDVHSRGIQYAFGAAALWAASTVSGKILLKETQPSVATFWRFFFGLIGLSIFMAVSQGLPTLESISSGPALFSLFYLSLIPGLFAMLIYYHGLSKTPASVTTFIELLYPIGAVALNTVFLNTPLGMSQTIAGIVLILSVSAITN